MAKRSRTRLAQQAPASTPPASSRRTTRRRPVRRANEPTFLERYGSLLLGGLVVAGVGLIVIIALFSFTQPTYACGVQLTPGPTEPNPTPRPSPTASPSPTISPSPTVAPSSTARSPSAPPSASASASAAPSASASAAPSASGSASPSPSASATPSASPQPQPTARLGFTPTDLGAGHVPVGQSIRYAFCPPTSGEHYNQPNANAPMRPAVYPPTQEWSPGYWVHDLEHGYTVVAYRCPSGLIGQGDCISQAELNQMEAWFEQAPTPPSGVCAKKALVVRLDSMATRFAVLAWNRALLVNEFDLPAALTFAQQWTDHPSVPEPNAC